MIIQMSAAVGAGPTELAAFDDALLQIGAANYNLIRLSSVIPPATCLVNCSGPMSSPGGAWGDRLYVVYADQRASRPGEEAWAGVGWVQDDTGRGLFVEHEADRESTVRSQIDASLEHLQRGRGIKLGRPCQRLIGGRVVDRPICALVLVSFPTSGWSSSETGIERRLVEAGSSC